MRKGLAILIIRCEKVSLFNNSNGSLITIFPMTSYNKIDKKYIYIWMDDLAKIAGKQWIPVAEDRSKWRTLGEAAVQQLAA